MSLQACKRFFQPDECLSEGGGGAGDVDAGEAFAARSEDFTVVEPQSGLVRDEVIERLAAQAGTGEVQPGQIGAFRFDKSHARQSGGGELAQDGEVCRQIGKERIEPVFAAFIGGLCGHQSGGVHLAVSGGVDFTAKGAAFRFVGDEDVGVLQAGEVEGFAG